MSTTCMQTVYCQFMFGYVIGYEQSKKFGNFCLQQLAIQMVNKTSISKRNYW